ncbi:MAG: class I SAM-dependent methyltransferase [Chloroflexi bacterium]|nr:class I SAM-dependent methyltransferase [Chloroflexota bacterium]
MTAPSLTPRQQREISVYDQRSATVLHNATRESLLLPGDGIPFPNREHVDFLTDAVASIQPLVGKRLLECGCGPGHLSVYFAKQGAHVSAVDVSPGNIALCQARASANGLQVDYRAAPVESLDYPDGAFDIIFGNQVFHHLERHLAAANIRRMLRPGGIAVFCEPVLMVQWVRKIRTTPPVLRILPLRRDTPDEAPLNQADIAILEHYFTHVTYRPYQLLVRAHQWIPMSDALFRALQRIDRQLLDHIPGASLWARWVVLTLR